MAKYLGNYLNFQLSEESVVGLLIKVFMDIFKIFLPVAVPIMVIGVIGTVIQTGFIHTGEPLKPQFSKLNPISGFKRMFSIRALVDLVKNLVIVSIVGYIGYKFVIDNYYSLLNFGNFKTGTILTELASLIINVFVKVGIALLIIGCIDFLFQKFQHNKDLKMTKQEIKEEYKQQEGDPIVKGKRKQKRNGNEKNDAINTRCYGCNYKPNPHCSGFEIRRK